ncbi:unnamed protein product [Spirodela intermedia]|uniref:Uncharacterized protein n=1 Tax=Spirodela intermedia TaxID=51605 RepID=A0A7I8J7K8_SPIIN|nr:unnamed protein product [Spirodela intermedia]CAA6666051.1 unnamed protein product [Spirodela intermedia]
MARRCSHCSNNGHNSRTCPARAGRPWTEEEHRMFLMGLRRLGKGDWRGIARNFVVSRTPTQVASHAQKYFIRQSNSTRRKRRSSLFDMVPDLVQPKRSANATFISGTGHCATRACFMQPSGGSARDVQRSNLPPMIPGFFPAYVPIPLSLWPSSAVAAEKEQVMWEAHEILKPTPFLPKDPANVDQLVRMSDLSLGDASAGRTEPSALSLELLGSSPRQSAFHVNAAVKAPALSQNNDNVVHAL